jgi:hypothetical protein
VYWKDDGTIANCQGKGIAPLTQGRLPLIDGGCLRDPRTEASSQRPMKASPAQKHFSQAKLPRMIANVMVAHTRKFRPFYLGAFQEIASLA